MRRTHDAAFKAKVALEAIKGEKTTAQLSSQYGVHPNQISKWKKRVLEQLPEIFNGKPKKADRTAEEIQAELYQQIGQLKVELDWLKKSLNSSGKGETNADRHNSSGHTGVPAMPDGETGPVQLVLPSTAG